MPGRVFSTSSSSRRSQLGSLLSVVMGAAVLGPGPTRAAGIDEYDVKFEGGMGLGLAIEDFGKSGKYRVYVSRVIKGSQAERSSIRVPALVVAVNGQNVEGLPKKIVVQLLKEAQQRPGAPVVVTFRDPAKWVLFSCVCLTCRCDSRRGFGCGDLPTYPPCVSELAPSRPTD